MGLEFILLPAVLGLFTAGVVTPTALALYWARRRQTALVAALLHAGFDVVHVEHADQTTPLRLVIVVYGVQVVLSAAQRGEALLWRLEGHAALRTGSAPLALVQDEWFAASRHARFLAATTLDRRLHQRFGDAPPQAFDACESWLFAAMGPRAVRDVHELAIRDGTVFLEVARHGFDITEAKSVLQVFALVAGLSPLHTPRDKNARTAGGVARDGSVVVIPPVSSEIAGQGPR